MEGRELVDTHTAARILAVSESTLTKWRHFGRTDAPPHIAVGHRIRYDKAMLYQWLDARTVRPGEQ